MFYVDLCMIEVLNSDLYLFIQCKLFFIVLAYWCKNSAIGL